MLIRLKLILFRLSSAFNRKILLESVTTHFIIHVCRRQFKFPDMCQWCFVGQRIKTTAKTKGWLTVSRCLPCLKSLIPDSRLSIHSSPPHWAMTPAILYTSSSSSSSSVIRSGETYYHSYEILHVHLFYYSFKRVLTQYYWALRTYSVTSACTNGLCIGTALQH